MKLFKKFAVTCLALTLCLGMASMVACGDKGNGNGNSQTESSSVVDSSENESSSESGSSAVQAQENAYNFLVKNADGSPAVGYKVQLCTTDDSKTCYMPSAQTDANGFVYITAGPSCPNPAAYEVHVLAYDELLETDAPVEPTATVYTPAAFSTDFITVTLA